MVACETCWGAASQDALLLGGHVADHYHRRLTERPAMVLKCDQCGRFTNHLHDVPCNPPSGGIDREVCDICLKRIGLKVASDDD